MGDQPPRRAAAPESAAPASAAPASDQDDGPTSLRLAVLLLWVEAVLVAGLVAFELVRWFVGGATTVDAALWVVLGPVVVAAALWYAA
ncbi:MAG TPA: hypothetical protein VGR21_09915, partial [Cryptosporangiaceae bacterium]|nr:hypothetical protein [Cryptosporangiaceae bacterium]